MKRIEIANNPGSCKSAVTVLILVGVLVFANWGRPQHNSGLWHTIYSIKWIVTGGFSTGLALILVAWFGVSWLKMLALGLPTMILAFLFPAYPIIAFSAGVVGISIVTATGNDQSRDWFESTWTFAKQILPLLFFGVILAGFLLGRPGHEGIIPSHWIAQAVGGNSLGSNLFAAVAGAFMYFATLTEVPILEGLTRAGMGKGPALALLLSGPALPLPNMLVIRSIMGTKKTIVYISLVVVMSTIAGLIFGTFWG